MIEEKRKAMSMNRVCSWDEVRDWRDTLDASGKRVVLTNGCFDLLHTGHLRYLEEARQLGDALVVAVNGDASVRELKGAGRPLNSESDRAELLAGLRCVDRVTVFPETRAINVIEAVAPHIYAKGGDYTPESLDTGEQTALKSIGAEVCILQIVAGRSTSRLVSRMQTRSMRLGVLGSGYGSTLEGLLECIDAEKLHAEIAVVVSDNAEARILELGKDNQIPTHFVDPGDNPKRFSDEAQKALVRLLLDQGVDLVVLAGFMRRLKSPVLDAFPDRVVNIHPSLLPKYRGLNAWNQALEAGDKESGCTVHLVNNEIDAGRILAQTPVPVLPGDTPEALHHRIQAAERELYGPTIQRYWDAVLSGRSRRG